MLERRSCTLKPLSSAAEVERKAPWLQEGEQAGTRGQLQATRAPEGCLSTGSLSCRKPGGAGTYVKIGSAQSGDGCPRWRASSDAEGNRAD